MLIATSTAMHYWNAHTFEPEGATALRTGRYLEHRRLTIYRWHLNLISKRRLSKADWQFIEDVIALALEELVRFNGEHNVQVTGSTTTRTDLTFACHTN